MKRIKSLMKEICIHSSIAEESDDVAVVIAHFKAIDTITKQIQEILSEIE